MHGLCFWASDTLIDKFYKNFQLRGLKPKNKGHTNFYECCDLTKKVYLTGIPAPSLEWWREDDQGEKLMLHTDSYARSLLHFGPLQRHHHNNKLSCEAKNNDQVQPVRRQISINMICKFH